jgi:hypothetical protein
VAAVPIASHPEFKKKKLRTMAMHIELGFIMDYKYSHKF